MYASSAGGQLLVVGYRSNDAVDSGSHRNSTQEPGSIRTPTNGQFGVGILAQEAATASTAEQMQRFVG